MRPTTKSASNEELLARGFALHVGHWAREIANGHCDTSTLESVAYLVSMASTQGHVCLSMAELIEGLGQQHSEEGVQEQLFASGVVGKPDCSQGMPLILDGAGRLYLGKYYDYECRLATQIARLLRSPTTPQHDLRLTQALRDRARADQPSSEASVNWQIVATAMSLLSPLTIISGGPGTGKTTTIVALLAELIDRFPDSRIALAAPTGKAAARMLEAIHEQAQVLGPEILSALPSEAFTIHRLLGRAEQMSHRVLAERRRLAVDVLIVDEASMLDLALATRLFEALPDHAKVVLVGDKDQLAAVESGAIFAELSASDSLSQELIGRLAALTGYDPAVMSARVSKAAVPMQDHVTWLRHNYRFNAVSSIGRFASSVRSGDRDRALNELRQPADDSLRWKPEPPHGIDEDTLTALVSGYADFCAALHGTSIDPLAVLSALEHYRILCATREGTRGVDQVAMLVQNRLRTRIAHPNDPGERSRWFPGQAIMILRNDYLHNLHNGDIGVVLPDPQQGLMVYFRGSQGSLRIIAPALLPEFESAFVTTIHKSQGSEFRETACILPANQNRSLTRELLYTAATRARLRMTLFAPEHVIELALRSSVRRDSGLLARISECL